VTEQNGTRKRSRVRVGDGSKDIKAGGDDPLIIKLLDCLARVCAVGVIEGNSVRALPT
jgi:hypothetical protein